MANSDSISKKSVTLCIVVILAAVTVFTLIYRIAQSTERVAGAVQVNSDKHIEHCKDADEKFTEMSRIDAEQSRDIKNVSDKQIQVMTMQKVILSDTQQIKSDIKQILKNGGHE